MTKKQKEDFDTICLLIDGVHTPKQFYEVCKEINKYDVDVVNSAREYKKFYNSAQYA
jgi:hypothetical protein